LKITAQSGKSAHLNAHVAVLVIEAPTPATPKTNHTVLVLDTSGSMAGSIDQVRSDSRKYVSELGEEDFVSVIVFSGHGQSKLIAGPTQCNAEGRALVGRAIDMEVRIRDTTVFSEPLALTLATVKRLAGEDTAHNAVLFTDGCAVPTRWGVTEEQDKAISVAKDLDAFGAVVSVIGYGVYYDEDFMLAVLEAAGNTGVYRHISEIDDFGPAIQCADEVFRDTRPVNIDMVVVPGKGRAGKVFKTTPELTSVGDNGHVRTRGAYQGQVTLYVELSEPCEKFTVRGRLNGKKVEVEVAATALTPESAKNFVFLKAAYAYIRGDGELAAEILRGAGADGLAEKAGASYTQREKRETADVFRRFFRDRKFIGEGLKPSGPNHCALNVLRTLIEDSGNVVYLAKGAYKRSGELTKDPRVIESPHGRSLKVTGYASHASRLNFSIRCLKDVKVLPEDGKGAPTDAKIWRTYNVILDGNLHLPTLEAVLTAPSFSELQAAGVIKADEKHVPGRPVTIDLRGVKMISSAWANPATIGLVELLKEEAELEAEQKALNARRKVTAATAGSGGDAGEDGADVYIEKAKKVEGIATETYRADCVEIRLMKYKSGDYDAAAAKMDYAAADARVKVVRQRLIVVRFLVRAITFAMEAVKSKVIAWDAGKVTKRGKEEKLEQSATFRGASLKRVTWNEQVVCS
jgi:hypothetical protein